MTFEGIAALADALRARGWHLATAESCTGGLIAGALHRAGRLERLVRARFVTYSNAAKTELLGVPAELIAEQGAVSEEVARAMARGARERSRAEWAVAVTGIAGPSGGSAAKPVGTVWLAWCGPGVEHAQRHCFAGDRAAVRRASVDCAAPSGRPSGRSLEPGTTRS